MDAQKTITWPIVALAGLVGAAFVGIFALIPDEDPTSRSALLAVITTLASAIGVGFTRQLVGRVERKVDKVQDMVNGHTSDLIARIPEANRSPAQRARHARRGPSLPGPESGV